MKENTVRHGDNNILNKKLFFLQSDCEFLNEIRFTSFSSTFRKLISTEKNLRILFTICHKTKKLDKKISTKGEKLIKKVLFNVQL